VEKRIVVCLDGTNNCFGESETNVLRMYRLASRAQGQVTYYQPGVGTIAPEHVLGKIQRFLLRLIDSATAFLLHRHVASAYRFLMQHYKDGDEVFVFGFSRGAYAARVLCGMLHKVGLLHEGMNDMVPFAWREYRRVGDYRRTARFRRLFSRRVKVHFLGIFDTVSAVGTPWKPYAFPYTAQNPDVAIVRHAMALDERRVMYVQNLWSQREHKRQSVRQVWFPGVHSDVGGGYLRGQDGLSYIALAWMLEEAKAAGLVVNPEEELRLFEVPDLSAICASHHAAPIHDSMTLAWKLLEYLPIPRWVSDGEGRFVRRFRIHRNRRRALPPGALVHESVHMRMSVPPLGYRPDNVRDSHTPVLR
jgi:uncharacterized protein (DUF2235 family)